MGIRAFIFDFDGTIGDSSECGLRATQEAFAELGYGIPSRDQIEYYMGIPIEQSFKLMLPHEISDTDFNALLTFFREKYATYEDEYLSSFAHVADTLRQLKARGSQLFVLSSKKTDVLHRNVATLGLIDLFTEIVGSDKVTAYKPDPAGILYLMHKYQLNPQQTIMIGDATFDIQMGNRAPVQTCAVTWGAHSLELLQAERPTFIVNCATEWLRLI
ncbi:HAD family hydrolase [Aerococcaceae bacterium NML160702]|nr:HAD family hydrolase [Aerococcaceae bacterium NML160702]